MPFERSLLPRQITGVVVEDLTGLLSLMRAYRDFYKVSQIGVRRSWSTLSAVRIAVMNDLYLHPDARGTRLADGRRSIALRNRGQGVLDSVRRRHGS
jgi:hypothetical protein